MRTISLQKSWAAADPDPAVPDLRIERLHRPKAVRQLLGSSTDPAHDRMWVEFGRAAFG